MNRAFLLSCAVLFAAATSLGAQQQQPPPPQGDPVMDQLFPPELIMHHQQALGLLDADRAAMIADIQRVQGQAAPIQWRLTGHMERLGALLRQRSVEEAQVLAQLDSVLMAEREMKRLQIGLLVRLRNRLSAEQQAILRQRMPHRRDH